MRTEPDKAITNSAEVLAKNKQALDAITRRVAILFVLAIVVFFFLKMLLP